MMLPSHGVTAGCYLGSTNCTLQFFASTAKIISVIGVVRFLVVLLLLLLFNDVVRFSKTDVSLINYLFCTDV